MTENLRDNGTVEELTGIFKHEILHVFGVDDVGTNPSPPTLANTMNLDPGKSCIENLRTEGNFPTRDILDADVAKARDCIKEARTDDYFWGGDEYYNEEPQWEEDGQLYSCSRQIRITTWYVCTDTCSVDSVTEEVTYNDCPPLE